MSVLTPGYILEISETGLLVNGFAMPVNGKVEDAIGAVFEQLSQLTLAGGAPGGLGVVIKDTRIGGVGEVSKTIPSGQAVTLASFAASSVPAPAPVQIPAPAPAAAPAPLAAPAPVQVTAPASAPAPAPMAVQAPVQAPVAAPAPAPAASPVQVERSIGHHAPTVAAEPDRPAPMSAFARLAQAPTAATVSPVVKAAPSPAPAEPVQTPQAPPAAAVRPSERLEAIRTLAAPLATPDGAVSVSAPAPMVSGSVAATDPAVEAVVAGLEPAADEIDFGSIFKDEDPIVDEGISTPIGQSLTARQRTEGFSLKSNKRREIERRRERKRKLIYWMVGVVTVLAALRIVGAVMAGPTGDYAAVCVDARTTERLSNDACASNTNPFAQTVYFAVGQEVPAVGSKAQGGTVEKPADPRSINSDVAEGRAGVVLDGGEVK